MHFRLDLIIWDVDGTILDTVDSIVRAHLYCFAQLGLPLVSMDVLRTRWIGPPAPFLYENEFKLNKEETMHAVNIFRERYKNYELLHAQAYGGVMGVLKEIQSGGIHQAVATNKRQDYASRICHHFEIDRYCDPIIGLDPKGKKQKVDIIKECIQRVGANSAVMIGDTDGDKRAAMEVGIDFIGVNYGYGFRNVPGYANSPKEILNCIERIIHDNAAFKQ